MYLTKTRADPLPLPHMEQALRMLAPDGKYATMVAVFDGRATYNRIKHWRKGRARPPEWARQLAADKLRAIAEPMVHLSRLLVTDEIKKPPG